MRELAAIGRILIGLLFAFSGVMKFTDIGGTAAYAESAGLPAAAAGAWIGAALELFAGAALAAGFMTRLAALALALFVLVAAVFFHDFWTLTGAEANMQQAHFMKNLMLAGALSFIAAYGPGIWSVGGARPAREAAAKA